MGHVALTVWSSMGQTELDGQRRCLRYNTICLVREQERGGYGWLPWASVGLCTLLGCTPITAWMAAALALTPHF